MKIARLLFAALAALLGCLMLAPRATQVFDYASGTLFWTDDDRVAEYLGNRGYRAAEPDDPGYGEPPGPPLPDPDAVATPAPVATSVEPDPVVPDPVAPVEEPVV